MTLRAELQEALASKWGPSDDVAAAVFVAAEALLEAAPGMLEIAEQAMPDTYLETDSRVRAFRAALLQFEELP